MGVSAKREIAFNINDATSRNDHVEKDMREPPRLSGPVPLPPEVISAADYLRRAPRSDILANWESLIRRLTDLVRARDTMQDEWGRGTPDPHREASAGIKSAAILHLMSQLGLGGSRRMDQFVYVFDVMGAFSHDGLFTPDEKMAQPAPPTRPF